MKSEIVQAINALAKEKGLDEEMLYTAIEEALKTAYKKNLPKTTAVPTNLSVIIDRQTGLVQVFARKIVTEEVEDSANQVTLTQAHLIRSDYEIGDIAEIDVTPQGFLRVAAQAAKQVIVQRIREAERGKVYDDFIEKENEILTAIVNRVENKAVYVELGRTDGVMESSEWMPGESYDVNDHIKVYVLQVQRSNHEGGGRTPQVKVSRIHPGLVKRLFEMEVPEIAAGVVIIKSIAREAGSRTKMAVYSTDPVIDPVGACVGPRGSRVESVVNELKNEKIDIIKWSEDPAEFVANALNPAQVLSVFIAEGEKACRVIVPDSQLSLAIGKEGQNARLAAKLTGWKIDIKSQSQAAELMGIEIEAPIEMNEGENYSYHMPDEPEAFYMDPVPLEDSFFNEDEDDTL